MLKKTVLFFSTLLLSSSAWAQMLIHLDLATNGSSQRQSIVVEENQTVSCQLYDLLFEVTAKRQNHDVNIAVKIYHASRGEKILVASPEFATQMEVPVKLALEKEGQAMELTIVAVDIV